MEKTIKMSLIDAKLLYNNSATMNHWLLQNFTKEELEDKKGYTWEEAFENCDCGYYIPERNSDKFDQQIQIKQMLCPFGDQQNKSLFKTEKQALSSLAFAQLSHIVAKYNEGKKQPKEPYFIEAHNAELRIYFRVDIHRHLEFYSKKDAETSLEVNNLLWKQYWMID